MRRILHHRFFRNTIALLTGSLYLVLCVLAILLLWDRVVHIDPTQKPFLFALWEIIFLFAVSLIITLVSGSTSHLKMLAGAPEKHNYLWQGGYSAFTAVILWTVMILRSVSTLQLCKLIYRLFPELDKDYASKRPNVAPFFQETYFLIWGAFLIVQVSFGLTGIVYFALDVYFLTESLTWVLYYAVFRRFFEESYSIYHVLEHLPIIFFLIPLQAIAYASTHVYGGVGLTWRTVLPALLGQADERMTAVSIIGYLYSAIVIGMIISSFPSEGVKPGNPNTVIIGAGDVVRNRLFPALVHRMDNLPKEKTGAIQIYTLETIDDLRNEWDLRTMYPKLLPDRTEKVYRLFAKNNDNANTIAWIETPSDWHLYYLELLDDHADLVVVEKPVVSNEKDLTTIREIIASERRKHVFFLSYYILEKALMLTFLRRPKYFYLKYLCGDLEDFYQFYLEMGQLKCIRVELVEAYDDRSLPEGGHLVETFIHHCLIASLFAGYPQTWRINDFIRRESDDQVYIYLNAEGMSSEKIELSLKKGYDEHDPKKSQTAELVFHNGGIFADLDKRSARARLDGVNGSRTAEVEIRESFRKPYAVQCDMVYDCHANHIDPSEIDGLYHQIEVLQWLLELDKMHPRTGSGKQRNG